MDVVVALHAAGALLLLIAGLAKLGRPAPTAEMLGGLGIPDDERLVRALGAVESAVGIGALAIGGPGFALATGVFYLGFVAVVVRALATGATSCGCFGRIDAPPSWIHVAGNVVFAAASFATIGADTPLDVMDSQPAAGVGFVLLVGILAGLGLTAFTALPEALAARRGSERPTFRIEPEGDRP